jgi:transcription elongation factor Elf1
MPQNPQRVLEGFVCPSCQATSYEPVTVASAFDKELETGVYRCSECNFGFLNPERYTKHKPA